MASRPHRIGLSAAWEPPAGPAHSDWVRHFGRPAGFDADGSGGPRVVLVWEGAAVALSLNGVDLDVDPDRDADRDGAAAGEGRRRHDVTARLTARNELRVRGLPPAGPAGRHGRIDLPKAFGSVWLEVEDRDDGERP